MLMFHSYVSLPKGIGYVNYPHFGGLHYPNSTEFPGYFSPAAVDRAGHQGAKPPELVGLVVAALIEPAAKLLGIDWYPKLD